MAFEIFGTSHDCPGRYHRWNCSTTPIWAQTIRDLDTNPWTCVTCCSSYVATPDFSSIGRAA